MVSCETHLYCAQLALQIRTDPAALPKFNALVFKLRSVMAPALAALTPLGTGDPQAGAAEVVTYFTGGLLTLTQRVLQARTSPPPLPSTPAQGAFHAGMAAPHVVD